MPAEPCAAGRSPCCRAVESSSPTASVWPSRAAAVSSRAAAASRPGRPAGWCRIWIPNRILAPACSERGGVAMRVVISGGSGFVGINLAATLLARGHDVTLYDRTALPAAAARSLADHVAMLRVVQGDIMDRKRIEVLVAEGCDAIVLGAAITAGPHLERTATERILQVNVMSQIPILGMAIRHRVRRVINLSSAAAYG